MIDSPNDLLRQLRKNHSRRVLAEWTGLTQTQISNIEKGRKVSDTEAEAIRRVALDKSSGDVEHDALISTSPISPTLQPIQRASPEVDVVAAQTPTEAPIVDATVIDTDAVSLPVDDDRQRAWGARVHNRLTDTTTEPIQELLAIHHVKLTVSPLSPTQLTLLDGFKRLSNSQIQTFKACKRKWWLAWYRNLQLKRETPVGARAIGDRVHRALKYWYVRDSTQRTDPRDALERLIVEDWTRLVNGATADDSNDTDIRQISPELAKKFQQEADLERVILDGYMEWLAETGGDSELEVVSSEAYLEANIPGVENTKMIGRLDARVRRVYDKVRLFIDHKVIGNFTVPTRVLHLDEQMLWYMLMETLQPDETEYVVGALYNMLRRVKRSGNAKPPFYQRVEVHHNRHELASFTLRLTGVVREIERARKRLDSGEDHRIVAYPTPTQDCHWKCDFFAICGMIDDGSRAEAAISNFYSVGDPMSYYQDDDVVTIEGVTNT